MAETSGDWMQERSWIEPEGDFLRKSYEQLPQLSLDANCLDTASRDSALSPRLPPASSTTETNSRGRHRNPHTRRPRRNEGEDEGEDGSEGAVEGNDGNEGAVEGNDGNEGAVEEEDGNEGAVEGEDGSEGAVEGNDGNEGAVEGNDGSEGAVEGEDGSEGAVEGEDGSEGAVEEEDGNEGAVEGNDGSEGAVEGEDGSEGAVEGEDGNEERKESLEFDDDSATSSLRIRCRRCEQLMEFDPGSRFVQCCRCSAINQVLRRGEDGVHAGGEVLGMICARCLTTNLTPSDKRLVRCGVCGTISVVHAKLRANSEQPPE